MPNNFFVEVRRKDKIALAKMLKENPDIDEGKILALFSLKTGYKIETIRRMFNELQEAGQL